MKKTKFSSIILLLTLSLIACEDKRSIFAEKIRSYTEKRTNPVKANELVNSFQNKLTILSYTLTLKELEEVKVKYDLSDSLIMQIKAAPFARTSGVKKIEEKTQSNYFTYEESLGAALKENDGKISFALIKTKSFAKLKAQYEKYPAQECHKVWIFFKKCHDVERQRQRELTPSEKIIVTEATKYSSINSLLGAVDILKKGDYELYMSDTGTIFSPDHKSVAHVTYFGNIAIGPTSELNSILPIDYEYKFKSYGSNAGGYLIKQETGNVIGLERYPKNDVKGITETLVMQEGKYFKFNYLIRNKTPPKFPTKFMEFIRKESLNGPYVLEVKKNGNVILYSQKDPNIILWTTNTANKGKGPYNFHLTNDKKLILEDSTGKILYQSPDYKEIPTIFYGSNTNKDVFNGQVLNKFEPIAKNDIHIKSDNNKYQFTYVAREKKLNTNNNNNNNNNNNKKDYINIDFNDPKMYQNSKKIDLFSVYTSNKKEYDVCYTAYFNCVGWTKISCNGEIVGLNGNENEDCYIENLIIYIKEKWESVPDICLYQKYTPTKIDLNNPSFA